MQAGVDRWLGADLAKEVGGKSVANGDFGTDDPNASRWSCGGPGKTRTCDLRFRKPLLYPAELRDRRNSAERHGTFSAAAPALPGRFFVHCHLPATFSSAACAMTSIVSPIEGQFLGRLGPRFGEVPVSWRLRSIRCSGHLLFRPSAAAGGPHGRATHPLHSRLVAQRRGALAICARRALAAALEPV